MKVKTPYGDLVAVPSSDPCYPGIWISLRRDGADEDLSVALVEYTGSESDINGPALVTRVWDDVSQEEHQTRVIHSGFGKIGAEGRAARLTKLVDRLMRQVSDLDEDQAVDTVRSLIRAGFTCDELTDLYGLPADVVAQATDDLLAGRDPSMKAVC